MSVAPLAPVSAAPPAQAVTGAGDLAPVTAADAAAGGLATSPQTATPTPPADAVLQALDVAKAAAAGRQASLAPLLADLAQAVASPALSGPAKAAIAQVLALQTPTDGPFTAQVVKDAVARSGLFLEAHLASLAPSREAPPDLKAALLVLRQVLAAVPAPLATPAARQAAPATPTGQGFANANPASQSSAAARNLGGAPPALPGPTAPNVTPAPAPVAAVVQAPAVQPGLPQTPSEPAADTPVPQSARGAEPRPSPAAQADAAPPAAEQAPPRTSAPAAPAPEPPARSATPAPAPSPQLATGATPTPQTPAAPAAQTPAAPAQVAATPPTAALPELELPPLTPPREDAPLDPRSAMLLLQRAFGAAPAPRPGPAARSAAPPPPLRQSATGAQGAEPAALPDGDEATVAQHLANETDQALARLTLHQLASLADGPGGPAWVFELPLATPQGAAMAQFVIERDEDGAASAGPSWKARFSIDIEPLGPVHIHLRVGRETSAVTLWAEREGAVARLRGQGAALGQALGADVTIHPGAPGRVAPPPGPGRFVDQSS